MESEYYLELHEKLNTEESFCRYFKETTAMFYLDYDSYLVIEKLTAGTDREKYRSLIDFMLVETFQEHKKSCMEYYKGNGSSLEYCEGVNEQAYDEYDLYLAETLILLATMYPKLGWSGIVKLSKYLRIQEAKEKLEFRIDKFSKSSYGKILK